MMTRLNLVLVGVLLLALPLAWLAGTVWIDPFHPAVPGAVAILLDLRLPRLVLGVSVGAGLGAAGAAMQGFLRNPLADPGVFGVAPTAAFGAVLALALGWPVATLALAGAGLAMALLGLAARHGSALVLALGGVMLASLAGALTSLVISLAPNPFALGEIVTWLMGGLDNASWRDVWVTAPLVVLGLGLLGSSARGLDALTLGEATARSLGVRPGMLAALMIGGVGLITGGSVASAGVLGFVGLVVPHLVRPFTDQRPSAVLLPAALAGAVLVVLADALCRIAPLATGELRLGLVLSVLGAPFVLALIVRRQQDLA